MALFTEKIVNDYNNPIEVYTHDIFKYADEYVESELEGTKDKTVLKDNFKDMIYYIRDRLNKPDNNNLELLDYIFCDVYTELCAKCNIIPTLEAFSWMLGINPNTLSAWKNGEYRKLNPSYSLAVKKWLDICKGGLTYELTQSKGGDINRIFIAKAVHGMAETAPVPATAQIGQSLDNRQLAARLGDRLGEVEAIEAKEVE